MYKIPSTLRIRRSYSPCPTVYLFLSFVCVSRYKDSTGIFVWKNSVTLTHDPVNLTVYAFGTPWRVKTLSGKQTPRKDQVPTVTRTKRRSSRQWVGEVLRWSLRTRGRDSYHEIDLHFHHLSRRESSSTWVPQSTTSNCPNYPTDVFRSGVGPLWLRRPDLLLGFCRRPEK